MNSFANKVFRHNEKLWKDGNFDPAIRPVIRGNMNKSAALSKISSEKYTELQKKKRKTAMKTSKPSPLSHEVKDAPPSNEWVPL